MDDPGLIAAIVVVFLLAGMVKGVIGLGLPTVSLGLMSILVDLPSAMALMLVPSFVTNCWQAAVGGNAGTVLRRTWPFLLMATFTILLGARALTRVDLGALAGFLGCLLIAYAATGLAGLRVRIDERRARWAGPLLGAINGIFTGMTGSFTVPGVMYLQSIGLSRDALIQAMGMLFLLSTAALGAALGGQGFLDVRLGLLSLAALVPAILGMGLGQLIRGRLSEAAFRRVFFFGLLALGLYLAARAALGA